MTTTLITGCNRGIGLELVKQLHERGDNVIGVCRSPSSELAKIGVRVIDNVDVSKATGAERLRTELAEQPVDVLINNAGVLQSDSFGNLDYDAMLHQFKVNSLGPLRVTEALSGNLSGGSKVAIVSSRVGSIDDNSSGGYWGYRTSKTAVNMIGANLALELRPRGIAVALLHPGLVATDMTNGQGVEPRKAAQGLIQRIDGLTLENSGSFWHAEGYELPW